MRIRHLAVFPLIGGLVGAAMALTVPQPATAQKLPVDCSGRRTSCYERRNCTLWESHNCLERTTEYWYWYYTTPTPT